VSTSRSLEAFSDFLRALGESGIPFVVIGGCAVGAYARMRGERVFSDDLDVYVRDTVLGELLDWAQEQGAIVRQRPQPRTIPVAVLEWNGLEINVLTASRGLPPPDVVIRTARVLELRDAGLDVPLADPLDLLANKMIVGRPKDQPHIEILRGFAEAEAVATFASASSGRERLARVRALLDVLGLSEIYGSLWDALSEHADHVVTRRFLVGRAPDRVRAEAILESAADEDERCRLASIVEHRFGT
jgi:hypothetical protein